MAFANVEGEVSRLNRTGFGFGLKESWTTRDGKQGFRYWAVFPESDAGVQVGDRVKVSGSLGTKVGDPKTGSDGVERRYVDHTVGNARVERSGGAQEAGWQSNGDGYGSTPAPAVSEPSTGGWYSDEAPF